MSATTGSTGQGFSQADLQRYLAASSALESTKSEVEALEQTEAVETFNRQMELLRRRLLNDPREFRDMFISDGMAAVAAEFRQDELSGEFIRAFWEGLLRDDGMSKILMRFVWDVPLGLKRKFIKALDKHLSDRYPIFKGLSENWPMESHIGPYIRTPEERSRDFELVNQGYLGYKALGLSQREIDLVVWLEVLRDKQCEERPCEIGLCVEGRPDPKGGCPVKIHIPQALALLGNGRFREAMELIEGINPLPNVTGRVCPQELQCQGVCAHAKQPIEIGQIEWFLPQRSKIVDPDGFARRAAGWPDPWEKAEKPPIAVVGSGPAGLINAYLLAAEGFPVTVFEAFHALGGVLRYGIPEFRLPNELIDDVVGKIKLLGGRFVNNFVVGKTATLEDLRNAGFWKVFVGSGAGLPRFLNVPGEHLLNVMSANEFLTRVNLMQGLREDYETPLPHTQDKDVLIIGGGNTAMDAARTARRLGGNVTIVYRRTRSEMPARVEELHHALEEGIALKVLRSPAEFVGDEKTHFVNGAVLEIMELGEPDASGRRSPVATGKTELMHADLVIMALGNDPNPIIRDSEPSLKVTRKGSIELGKGTQKTSLEGIYSGGDAARGGSTAIRAAGDGQAAAREIVGDIDVAPEAIRGLVKKAGAYAKLAASPQTIVERIELTPGIIELSVYAPMIARAARAGQFVRVLGWPKGELIPLTLADWDEKAGTICLVVQGMGTSSIEINRMKVGDAFTGIAGPLGRPSELHRYDPKKETVVFTAGGVGLPPVYPIAREHLRLGNHVTLIAGFRSADLLFWTKENERVGKLQAEFGDRFDVIYTSNDGTFGLKGFVSMPLEDMLKNGKKSKGRKIAEVVTIGPPLMMRAVADLTRPYGVKTVASLNSIMVDATGMCGACMVPVTQDGKLVRKHACVDGPEIDAHAIDWDKFLPRFNLFKTQEQESKAKHGF
ncbi:MAG: sulfide/dihydroorotate dehydrogenase-like FAD/NAD-binding protein [Candidatus Accumulibacter sp.]|jgi:glutamate synthase (NADPH/NADH) small chain|nr:sulfide/dihydroorotate dehydrogenase-like FAD/NAD-binding protein [Accumulibacter sp.]